MRFDLCYPYMGGGGGGGGQEVGSYEAIHRCTICN